MKQSKTTLKELTAAYRAVLRHGILCNAIALGLIAAVPARAETITYSGYNGSQGALAIIDGSEHIGGEALVFENNTSTSHGAGLYYKVTDDGLSSSVILDATSITFNNNASNYDKSSGGALFNSGGEVSILGDTNVFTNNHISGVDGTKPFKRGGGAVANQSYETESNSEPKVSLDATMVIGKLDGTSENTFSNNTSSMNGGAIMNRALDTDGNATLTINGTTTFDSNTAAMNGGAIYNVQRDGKTATVNLNNGEYTFTNNVANGYGGAIYNEGTMTVANATFGGVDSQTSASLGNTAIEGGAIYNSGTLSIANSDFMGNEVTGQYGGALLNNGTATINGGTFSGNQTGAQGYGGAIFNNFGLLTLNGVTFSDNNADWDGGAISSATPYFKASTKPADFEGDVINEETIRAYWQTKTGFDAKNKMVIVNSTFDNNSVNGYSGGAVSVYSDAIIHQSHFTNNTAPGSSPNPDSQDGGGAIYAGGWARLEITGSDFSGNSSNYGGAIATTRAGREDGAYLDITDSVFDNNTATVAGGAISNAFDNAILTDVTFTNNTAAQMGGAIYNEGGMTIAAMDKDVDFYGNTANGVDNDIYNAGSLSLSVAPDKLISLAGGIDGLNGTLSIGGGGLVDISNALNNQTVTVGGGQLHLSDPMTLTNTTINVASYAALNTLDNAINDYSSHVFLGNDAGVMVDVSSDGIDTFNIADGKHAHVEAFTMLSDLAGDSAVRHLADYGYISVNSDFHAYTTESMYSLAGNSLNDGTVTITKAGAGTGGLFAAINGTTDEDYQGMYYSLTGNDTSVDSGTTLRNAEIDVLGAGTGDGDYGIALNGHIVVDGQSSFVTHNAKIEGNGSIENSEGGEIGFNNSKIGVEVNNEGIVGIVDSTLAAGSTFENRVGATTVVFDSVIDAEVVNYGRWISDPSTYSSIIHNYSDEISFDNDTFTSTAELENMGTADLKNGVTFANGAEITGTGVINLVDGTTHFNDTVSSNTINLLTGADFDGVLTGTGILNMSNGAIDTVTGGVAGGGLIVDANLKGAGTIDTLTGGTTGAKIKTINVLNSEYGTAGSLSLNIGGATLDDDLQINGMNYYTNVAVDGENLVLSDKLMNTSGLHAQLGSWNGTIIGTSSTYDAETNSYTSTGTTVGEALTALETAVNGKVGASDIYTATITNEAVENSNSKVVSVTSFQNSIANLKNSANTWAGVQGFTNGITIGSGYGITGAGAATVSSLTMGGQTVSGIDTSVVPNSSNLVTSGAVYSAIGTAVSNTVGHASTNEDPASGVYVAIEDNAAATAANTAAIAVLNGTGANSVSGQIASNAQNATYTAGEHAAGTIGAALDTLTSDVSTLNTTVSDLSSTVSGLTGTGSGSISGQIASNAQNATYTAGSHGANTIGAAIDQHTSDIAAIDGKIGDMTEFDGNNYATDTASVSANLVALDGQLKTTSDKVDKLNADENTDGSVRNIAKSYFDLMAQDSALTLSEANAYTDKRIEKLDQDLSAGIASAVALSSVAVSDVRRGELSVGAGYGYFNGQSAGAFGAAMGISNRWSVNAGAGISGYDVSFRAGTNYKFKVF